MLPDQQGLATAELTGARHSHPNRATPSPRPQTPSYLIRMRQARAAPGAVTRPLAPPVLPRGCQNEAGGPVLSQFPCPALPFLQKTQ